MEFVSTEEYLHWTIRTYKNVISNSSRFFDLVLRSVFYVSFRIGFSVRFPLKIHSDLVVLSLSSHLTS